jgi:phospholipase C
MADKLPQVSWIVAPEAFSEHPNWPVNFEHLVPPFPASSAAQ